MVWEGQPQRAARAAHPLGVTFLIHQSMGDSHLPNIGDPRGGRSLRGRVSPAPGNPHDGSEVGLRHNPNARACGHKVDGEKHGGGAMQLGSGVLLTVPSAVRDSVNLS